MKNGTEKPRPASKLQHAVRDAPGKAVRSAVHREVSQHEDDNVGVESVHKLEEAAEQTVRAVETAHRSHQLKPYCSADRAEARADSANLDALQKQAQQQNSELQSNPYSRWQQKRAIKKEYAAAKAGVLNFTKGLYVELQPYHVRATCIIPAAASTGFQKGVGIDAVEESLSAEDIANAVFYVANQPEGAVVEEMTVWGTSQRVEPL